MSVHKDQQDQTNDQTPAPAAANQDRDLSDADLAQVSGGQRMQDHVAASKTKTADKTADAWDKIIRG